jgi:hypothetical protein
MKGFKLLLLISTLLFITTRCSEDNVAPEDKLPDVPPSTNLIVDEGSIGLVIDTRPIARKGYFPVSASISFSGALSDFSTEVSIDPNTNVGTLKIKAEDLTDDILDAFKDGVDAEIEITGRDIASLNIYSGSVRVDHSNNPFRMDTDLARRYPDLVIDPETPYFIQAISDDDDVSNKLYFLRIDNSREAGLDPIIYRDFYEDGREYFKFYFEPINDTLYHIKMNVPGRAPFYLRMSGPGNFYSYFETNPANIDVDIYKFVVKRAENGLVKIKPLSGNPLSKNVTTWYGPQVAYSDGPDDYIPVRMVAANITWTVEDRGTLYNAPIMPPAKLDFAYKSILKNCSSATLTETVGKTESQTKSYTVGTEESLELYSSHEASVEVTAGVETEASLFGQSASVSVEVSAGYTYTTSSTNTTTNTWEETVEETVEISRVRDVEIPPFTSVEVFDAIQTIEDVKIPFVQVLRVQGNYDDDTRMTGSDIQSQLLANQFGGVISAIGDDYVDISIRGTSTVNKFFEVESQVNEIDGDCEE